MSIRYAHSNEVVCKHNGMQAQWKQIKYGKRSDFIASF